MSQVLAAKGFYVLQVDAGGFHGTEDGGTDSDARGMQTAGSNTTYSNRKGFLAVATAYWPMTVSGGPGGITLIDGRGTRRQQLHSTGSKKGYNDKTDKAQN